MCSDESDTKFTLYVYTKSLYIRVLYVVTSGVLLKKTARGLYTYTTPWVLQTVGIGVVPTFTVSPASNTGLGHQKHEAHENGDACRSLFFR